MSQTTIWDVEFRIIKLAAGNASGPVYSYVKPSRRATVAAATPGGILAVLQADVPVGAGETIEILTARQGQSSGTENIPGAVLS